MDWLKSQETDNSDSSIISRSFIKTFHWIIKWAPWDIGNGKSMRIGVDPYVGDKGNFIFPMEIIEYLNVLEM